jgi:hypothetical protein
VSEAAGMGADAYDIFGVWMPFAMIQERGAGGRRTRARQRGAAADGATLRVDWGQPGFDPFEPLPVGVAPLRTEDSI